MSEAGGPPPRSVPGWVFLAALALYTVVIFYGFGVPARGIAQHWYEPRTFLAQVPGIALLFDSTPRALVAVGLPALGLAAGVFLTTRSAVARALAISFVLGCLLFAFYGVQAPGIWQFFGWRGSAVLWLLALCVGFAAAAPLLAASWLRHGWALRLALYLPVAFTVIAFLRNATGTDPALKFSISPWPVVPVFGLEVGAFLVLCWLAGAAVGVAALARAPQAGAAAPAWRIAGVALGLAVPALLLLAGGALELLPFSVDARTLLPAVAFCGLTIAGVSLLGVRGRGHALAQRARWIAVGAALIGVPLVTGQALALWDYHVTRERRARVIIDALQAHFEREQEYPDSLQQLVESGDLERIPTPSIGFSFLYDGAFRYQNNGPDFILEFPAPRWVECAYTPPWEDDYEDEEADVAASGDAEPEPWENAGDGSLDEAWSCPSSPPELW